MKALVFFERDRRCNTMRCLVRVVRLHSDSRSCCDKYRPSGSCQASR
eukprot:XP_001705879.1 Hypothetical protein GL50803_7480 [Giardia lamblia ATCC 50803]